MIFTERNFKQTLSTSIVLALISFFLQGFAFEIELTPINLLPYLFSAVCGGILAFLYLYIFPSHINHRYLTFFIPGIALLILLITTGLYSLWLIEESTLMMGFVFGRLEISKPVV